MLERYGSACAMNVPALRNKIEGTCLERFGHKSAFQKPGIFDAARRRWRNQHDVSHWTQSEQVKEKRKASYKARHCHRYHPTEHWLGRAWGSLRLDPGQDLPVEISEQGAKAYRFLCSCGRTTMMSLNRANNGRKSCGRCTYLPTAHWLSQKWGTLRLDPKQSLPEEMPPQSNRRLRFICDCGKTITSTFCWLVQGDQQSCGCALAGRLKTSPARKIYDYVLSLSPDAEFSFHTRLGGRRVEYDIYIPSKRLAIEYHGLYWHQEALRGKDDYAKYLLTTKENIRLLQVYQDEWEEKPEVVRCLIRRKLQKPHGARIRPKFCMERCISPETRSFLDAHHYLGASGGCLGITARHPATGGIVGAWVFMRRGDREVIFHRASWDDAFRAWNSHGKALRLAIPVLESMGFKRMVTFSDNRLFTGGMYEKLGFKLEKCLKPDYSYTNGHSKRSKYALRVPAGTNERAEAEKLGWHRIWDSGKKRWTMDL